ncbi:GspE/PulE family protein [Sphingomonas sp.]|uniref:GspE/PulE family protein n=1 Tax=Sphingomonas sp. TaxID=28214 RepID=UPI0035C81EE3
MGSSPGRPARVASLEALLRERRLLPEEAIARALLVRAESGERLDAVLTRLGLLSEEALARAMAEASGLPLVQAAGFPEVPVAGPPLSVAFLHDQRALPIAANPGGIEIAVADPFAADTADAFRFVFGRPVRLVVARGSDVDHAIDRLYRPAETEGEVEGGLDEDDIERMKDLVSDAPVIRAVNRLIQQAVDGRASDIHVEPTDDALAVRFRIDGVLREAARLPMAMRAPLVSRVKVMANLNIAERRLPQDGRMRIAVRGQEIDLRVATAPSIHGESVVMRILDRSKLALDFGALGFDDDLAERLREAIKRPHGIVLVTGPTGSGKTTTLYAALSELNSADRKLLTVEDPIEYRLPGVIQTQVNPGIGFTFGAALRSFLRQDPDVMMVGEIRDRETAEIAVQAALTGHMILSTLHTNTAAGAVTRLLDMEVEPFLLSSVLAGVLAQRLVRRLCPHCRAPFEVEAGMAAALGLSPGTHVFHRAVGCGECGGSGYAGRIALLEFIRVDEAITRLILSRADTGEIARVAAERGNRSLMQDGLAKAERGLTTVEEVLRVAVAD